MRQLAAPPGLAWYLLMFAILLCLSIRIPCGASEFILTDDALAGIKEDHGDYAHRRVEFWQQLIRSGEVLDDLEKLRQVNDFFNGLEFVSDIIHWGKTDYWATPLQTLLSNGGDCEDFSIAKYFTLLEMGIPAERMRLTYVKALRLNQAHMVLTYFPTSRADPLILDNLESDIRPATQRNDLLPVYSFNGDNLWLAKTRQGESTHVGPSDRLGPWRDVIARINDEQFIPPRTQQ